MAQAIDKPWIPVNFPEAILVRKFPGVPEEVNLV
jgi:hypothetical protein